MMALPEKKAVTDFASDGRPLVIGELPKSVRPANQKARYALMGLGLVVLRPGFVPFGYVPSPVNADTR